MGITNFLGRIFKRARAYTGADAWIGRPNNIATGRYLTPDDALKVSAFYAGTRYLAESVAMLPIVVYRKLDGGGKERNQDHALWPLLRYQPNALQDAFQFKEMMMVHLVMRGNFYAQKIFSGRGKILELYPLNPDNVEPTYTDPGNEESLVYRVQLPKFGQILLPPSEVLHIRGLGTCGVKGLSPIDLMMQTIGIATAQEEHAGAFFGKGVRASGVLEHPNRLTKEAADRIRTSFDALYAGSENAYRTVLLEEGLKWNQVSLTNEQSQFLQSRQFTVNDIARWLRVPPHKIGDLTRSTNNNIEHQGQEAITDSLGPWFVRIEQALLRQCCPQREWETTVIEFLVDALLRGDTKSRYEAYNIARNAGFMNVDEIRERENLNPLPEGKGQIYLEPLNMKPAGEEDPSDTQGDSGTGNGSKMPKDDMPDDDMMDNPPMDQQNAWALVFESRIERALRREVTARSRANGDNGKMLEYLTNDLQADIRAALKSLLALRFSGQTFTQSRADTLSEIIRCSAETLAKRYARLWVDTSEEKKQEVDSWLEKRAPDENRMFMNLLLETYRGIHNDFKA